MNLYESQKNAAFIGSTFLMFCIGILGMYSNQIVFSIILIILFIIIYVLLSAQNNEMVK